MPIEKIDSSFYVGQVFGMVADRRVCQSYNIFLGIKPSIGWLQGALPDRYIKNVVMVGYNYRRAQTFYYFLGMGKAYYMLGVVDWEKNNINITHCSPDFFWRVMSVISPGKNFQPTSFD